MTENKIYINGIETRKQIDAIYGKSQSMKKACNERGLKPETLNRACLNGYGSPSTITKYMQAGIPVVLSSAPVPSRRRREHSRVASAGDRIPAGEQINLEAIYPKQFETIKNTEAKQLRDIIIKHLTAMIEDLRRI